MHISEKHAMREWKEKDQTERRAHPVDTQEKDSPLIIRISAFLDRFGEIPPEFIASFPEFFFFGAAREFK